MRLLLVLVALVLLSAVMADKNQARYRHKTNRKWAAYKTRHLKNRAHLIKNDDEEEKRFMQFTVQDEIIEDNNAKFASGESSFKMEHNALSVLSDDEMRTSYLGTLPVSLNEDHVSKRAATTETWVRKSSPSSLPKSIDWRKLGWNQEVRQQGGCGSCWAFSSTAVMEAQIWMATGELIDLSEQYLNDCDKSSYACSGGWPHTAVRFAMDNGIPREKMSNLTEYQGVFQGCKVVPLTDAQKTHPISNLYMVKPSHQTNATTAEQDMMDMLVNNGPIMVVIWVNDKFRNYADGIFKNEPSEVGRSGNHAVTIVGYDEDKEGKYWIIRNSWDYWWGIEGHIKFDRSGINHGSLLDQSYSPFAATKAGRTRIGPNNPATTLSTTKRTTTTTDPCPAGSPCAEWDNFCMAVSESNGNCLQYQPYCKRCDYEGTGTKVTTKATASTTKATPATTKLAVTSASNGKTTTRYDPCPKATPCIKWGSYCIQYANSVCVDWGYNCEKCNY